jgi:threonine/homoserine/homoserine lactone efflux protein
MEATQEVQPDTPESEQAYGEQDQQDFQQEEYLDTEKAEETQEQKENKKDDHSGGRDVFINGLAVGLGIGCLATFAITWISLFFTPQLPQFISYESLLSIFIYPLVYLLAIGLVALTAGVVRQYYSTSRQ